MSEKVSKSIRVPADLAAAIEREAEAAGVSETDVMRRWLRKGEQYDDHVADVRQRLHGLENQIQVLQSHAKDGGGRLFG